MTKLDSATVSMVLSQIEHDTFSLAPSESNLAYRRGWNDHAAHVLRLLREWHLVAVLDRASHDPGDEDR